MTDNPFKCTVYDKRLQRLGWINDPVSIAGSVKFNKLGNFEYRLRAGDPMIEDILTKGTRIGMEYREEPLLSGVVRTTQGSVQPNGDVVFQLQDDWRMLINSIARVRPYSPAAPTSLASTDDAALGQAWLPGGGSDAGPDGTTQGQFGYYLWPDGSSAAGGVLVDYSESAIKNIIESNLLGRLGRPIVIAPDLQRGGNARAEGMLPLVRMSRVDEAVQPLLDWSGLGLRLIQLPEANRVTVDVYEPETWEAVLTPESGIIPDGQWSLNPPNATRALIGGPGEGIDRAFYEVQDATGLEDEYGDVIEVFRDATGASLNWPGSVADAYKVAKYYLLRPEVASNDKTSFVNYLAAAGVKGLSEGAPSSGVAVTLSETETFHFGGADGIQLGESVTIQAAGQPFTDRVTECKFSLTKDGFKVDPIVGNKTDDPDRMLAEAIARLAGAQRRLSTSR